MTTCTCMGGISKYNINGKDKVPNSIYVCFNLCGRIKGYFAHKFENAETRRKKETGKGWLPSEEKS